MAKSDVAGAGPSRGGFSPDYLSTGIAVVALLTSFGLQFLHYGPALTGRSGEAVSGATILSVSLVFTGLMLVATYHYARRSREYQLLLEESDPVADIIAQSEAAAATMNLLKRRLSKPGN